MSRFTFYAILTLIVVFFFNSNAIAGPKEPKGWRATKNRNSGNRLPATPRWRGSERQGYGLYLGLTPFYDISPRLERPCPHIIPHLHIGNHHRRYHHRGNVLLPNYGVGVGVGIRYGVFRSRNLGLGIHIR